MRRPRRPEDFRDYSVVENFSKREKDYNPSRGDDLALFFPSNYRVAASSLSFSWVRDLFSLYGVGVERFFYGESFRRFYSLESLRPIDEFRVIAFSYNFELDLLNIMDILKKLQIPLKWKERDEHHPLILVGGAMTYFNPSSVYPIADIIYRGDLETGIKDISDAVLLKVKREILDAMRMIPFVEIPRFEKRGKVAKFSDLNSLPPVGSVITPDGEFRNSFLIEIGRGCIRRCAFCMIGHLQKPARFLRTSVLDSVVKNIPRSVKIGLISATVTDYPWMDELLDLLEGRSFSVSSMRMDGLNLRLMRMLRESGQRSFTVAPEGGSQRVRDILKKDINEEHIERALILGRKAGFDSVKMYFIYGVSRESERDLAGISDITRVALKMGYRNVKLSLNPLIPKPGTPLVNDRMEDVKVLESKKKFLQGTLKIRGVKAHFESLKGSVVQYEIANATSEIAEEYVEIFNRFGKKSLKDFIYREHVNVKRGEKSGHIPFTTASRK